MAFDLSDAWDRVTNQGKYGSSRHKGSVVDNLNPWGKSDSERFVSSVHPLGKDAEGTSRYIDKGELRKASDAFHSDNIVGDPIKQDYMKHGATKEEAQAAGHTGTTGTVASLFAGGWLGKLLKGGSAGATSGSAGATSGTTGATQAGTGSKIMKGLDYAQQASSLMGNNGTDNSMGGGSAYAANKQQADEQARKQAYAQMVAKQNALLTYGR